MYKTINPALKFNDTYFSVQIIAGPDKLERFLWLRIKITFFKETRFRRSLSSSSTSEDIEDAMAIRVLLDQPVEVSG